MTVREFAERVLFSDRLDDKLAPPPDGITDDSTGPAIDSPQLPGRPAGLRLAQAGDRVEFPRAHELCDEPSRGRLLHFLANHELLATELMALALLKFPDAPKTFRQALLHTLREEQLHTQWYRDRMRDYGVSFGEFPVNGFFWSAVADMATPLDYVTRLPLTFEQANLDFSLHYRDLFQREGDVASARLMEKIHDDEVAHVGCGLRWFRKWKEPQESDWSAFHRRLIFPLSPSRAKGKEPLDIEGRRRAGLTDSFIRELELFSRSRGRTPQVYLFNPQAEFHVAAAGTDAPPRPADASSHALARDLDLLPIVLARREDVVLVRAAPRPEHLRKLRDAGIEIPEIEVLDSDGQIAADSLTRERKLGGLRPWAWSPDSARVLDPLADHVGGAARGMGWNAGMRPLFSKAFAAGILRDLGDENAGRVVDTAADASAAVEFFHARGHATIALKAAFGLAGRSQRRITTWAPSDDEWIARMLAAHGQIIVEPWLERVADFSVQCNVAIEGTPRLKGFTKLETDVRGKFLACRASTRFAPMFAPEIARFFSGDGRGSWLRDFYQDRVFPLIAPHLAAAQFHGALGIDAFVFRDSSGGLHLRPVVEINPRFTMGRVTWELLRLAAPGSTVRFSLATFATARAAGLKSLRDLATHLETTNRLEFTNLSPQRRLSSGTLVLNDATQASRFLAVLRVN